MPKADLHIHTTYSDGKATPGEVVREALDIGLAAIAITDHDAIGGIGPAMKAARGRDIEVVPGVELSSYLGERSVHVVGLYIDRKDGKLLEHLDFFRHQRLLRGKKIIKRLNELGVRITIEDVLSVSGNGSVGRPHIAETLFRLGAVGSFDEAFKRFLGRNGPAYVPKYKISPKDAAQIIHEAFGVAILAHPGVTIENESEIREIMGMGMDGIEISHPMHRTEQYNQIRKLASREGWLMSGGSDYHGEGRGLALVGDCSVEAENLDKIINYRNSK